VVWAANGHEALARLHGGRPMPGLILLDLMMPVMDGWEFLVAQQDDPALARIPVIVISADHALRHEVAQLEVAGYLPKPFEYDALLDTVQRYC
jgi:CheY-like chemotaxis protein